MGTSGATRYGGTGTVSGYVDFDASLTVPTSGENRPRNISVTYCIKVFVEISDIGTIQVESALSDLVNKVERQDFEKLPIRKLWISQEYKPVLNTPTIAEHKLNIDPLKTRGEILLKCVGKEGGYSVGDFGIGAVSLSMDGSLVSHPLECVVSINQVQFNTGNDGIVLSSKTNGTRFRLNYENWRYIFRIWY